MKRNRLPFPEEPPCYPPNLSFLLGLSPSVMKLGLGNMRRLLGRLGTPERTFRPVVVAGTNGKGSVTAYLSSILEENGLCAGRFLSPHVYSVTERISVREREVSLEEMERAAARVRRLYERIQFSYFEALTAVAFLIFAERGVEYAVLEVGLGGRFDATNVVEPVVCVLTNVSLDHRKLLGDSEDEILREKLGITREGVPLLVGRISGELFPVIEEKARRDRFALIRADDVGKVKLLGLSFESMEVLIEQEGKDLCAISLPFPGEHQLDNVLLAVGAAGLILGKVKRLEGALGKAYLPGRFESCEVLGKRFVMDVAHNDGALIAVARTLASLSSPERNAIVLGMLDRKELFDFPGILPSAVRKVFLVRPKAPEACPPQKLLSRIGLEHLKYAGVDVVVSDWEWEEVGDRFVDSILHPSSAFDVVLVTGSHRMVEAFGSCLHRKGLL